MALSAPASKSETHLLSQVILAIAVLSATGALWMIMGFLLNKSLRTFRHQLILGLAISDLLMAVNFLSSSAINLSGGNRNIGNPEYKNFCSFNGFMIQTFVDQTDYWVLLIAVCTFVVVNDTTKWSEWVRRNRLLICALPWFFSLLWATLGLVLAGYGSIGAWCWFTSDKTRLLVNFLPRWIIIAVVLAVYVRLYFVLNRARDNFISMEDSDYATGSRSNHLSSKNLPVETIEMDGNPENMSDRGFVAPSRPSRTRRSKGAAHLKRLSYQMMLYPLVYMLIWVLPTSIRIYQATRGKPAPFSLATIDKSCIVVQGFFDAVIYGINEKTWKGWKEIFTGKKGK